MTDISLRNIDRDLMVLEDNIGDCGIPSRDWDAIVSLYNINNKKFPIPALICSKIIQRVKDGEKPNMVFKEFGINYTAFKTRYTKTKTILEECASIPELNEAHWSIINTCLNDPAFLLGEDLERASAFHYNKGMKKLEELSVNAQSYERFLSLIHPSEFQEKNKEDRNIELVIKIAPGLIDSI